MSRGTNQHGITRRSLVASIVAAAIAIVVLVGGAALIFNQGTDEPAVAALASEDAPADTTDAPPDQSTAATTQDLPKPVTEEVALATGGSPPPDFEGAVAGDEGGPPLPLGVATELPTTVRLDFLFEFCWGPCFRDAHFMDPGGSGLGSGPFPAGEPFHVRHGFVNDGESPLGDGFDVAIYVIPMDAPGEFGGEMQGPTVRYTSDYVVRATADRCGPNYGSQDRPVECEWFVHEFADGLPAGRHALWAVWEAPCAAWIDYGFVDSCSDPDEVMSMFSSGVDSPFGVAASYTEADDEPLTEEELAERYEGQSEELAPEAPDRPDLEPDASGAAATGGSPLPDIEGATPGDDGAAPLPLGTVTTLPESVQLDFLFEFCWGPCFRDGHFMDPSGSGLGSGPFLANKPFHVRHGFANTGDTPLGAGFDVAIYVLPLDAPGEFGGETQGTTVRYTSDYVIRGESEACGPTYRIQQETATCEWFVHEFPDGLPSGRHALWAVWEAPCSAWVDYGFADSCDDPDEVLGLFQSGFDSPFDDFGPDYAELSEAP